MSTNKLNFKIGEVVNLTKGLSPDWNPQNNITNIFIAPNSKALDTNTINPITHRGQWSFPDISLHETAQSLLDSLIPYQIVNPASDVEAPQIGSGALLIGAINNKLAIKELSATLGVDLGNKELRYALVKLNRLDGKQTHASSKNGILVHARPRKPDPSYRLSENFVNDSTSLRHLGKSRTENHGKQLTKEIANKVIDSFAEYGTHYISSVDLGDTIVQVFAYPINQFEQIKKAYTNNDNPLHGLGSQDFVQFTTSLNEGIYGYVQQYGKIFCLSNSDIFNSSHQSGKWLDNMWSNQNSVFSLFNTNSELSLETLDQKFLAQTTMNIDLASLSVMIEHKRALIWQRIFKAAMVQKYRTNIDANFTITDDRNFVKMLPEDQAGIISYIATPTINLYKARLNISNMQFVAAENVNNFILLANVLSAEKMTETIIPGRHIQLYGQIIDMRTNGQAKSICINDDAYDDFNIFCDEFLGALSIQNNSGTAYNLIVDGLVYGLTDESENESSIIIGDVREIPDRKSIPELINSIQFSMTFAEAVVSDQSACPNDEIQVLVRSYLRWLANIIPSDSNDIEIIALRVRAMDLSNYAINPNYGSFVPILPFTDYERYIQSILQYLDRIQLQIAQNEQKIATRRLEELTINVGKTLNKNIIESGELILGIVDANMQQQNDLEGFYDALITRKKAEAEQQQNKINDLQGALFVAQADMDQASQVYKSAVKKWETMQAIKLGIDIATTLFSLGTSIAIPSSAISAVKELGAMAQMIQKALNVINATSKLYTGISSGINGLKSAQENLDNLDGADFGNLSTLSWDEMSIHFTQIMATGPDVAAEKAALKAAFATLILRGKAYTSAKSTLHVIQRDIYTNEQQKQINAKQADRLKALQDSLHPAHIADLDINKIDLISLSGHMSFVQNQMLTILSKAFLLQDLALQYANLQPATPILSFSLLKFSAAIVLQKSKTIEAKSLLAQFQASTTKPIDFVIEGVLPEQITNGNTFSTNILLNAPEFYKYVDSRIVSVVAKVQGVQSTESDSYLLKLQFNGSSFHDRSIHRDPLNFRTPMRQRVYDYEVKDNSPNFTDKGTSWSDGVSRITPFSTWEISFPKSKTNENLKFNSDSVTITLSFVLEARIVDAVKMANFKKTTRNLAFNAAQPMAISNLAMVTERAALTTPANLPSATALIKKMYAQGSCTNGWDVVFNMGLTQINNSLKDQYADLKKDPSYKNTITINTSQKFPGVTVITKFTMNYGYPLLNFSVNNAKTATLSMEILDGTMQKCSIIDGQKEVCTPPTTIKGETLNAVIELTKVKGQVKVNGSNHNVLKVQLNMQEGTFKISKIKLSDAEKVEFNKAVKAYFVNNPVIFLINQLDLTNIPTLEALKPNDFLFHALQTPDKNQMLQLFIMTGGRPLLNGSQMFLNNIPEPLPIGQSSSMIISSKLFFRDVLPKSLSNNNWSMVGVDPGNSAKAWSGKLSHANINANVDLTPLNHTESFSSGRGSGSMIQYSYSIPGGNPVAWSLEGTALTALENGQIHYGGTKNQKLNYTQKACSTYYPCFFGCGPKCSNSSLSSDVNINSSASLPLKIKGTGRNQLVALETQSKEVTVTGHLSGGGPSGSDDLEAKVNTQIKNQIPQQIASKLSFDFNPVSVFALKNLLFPSKNYIVFSECAVPGDLLLLGNFDQLK